MIQTKTWYIVLLVAAVVLCFVFFGGVIGRFAVAAVIAYLLSPLTDLLVAKSNMRRGFAVLIVLVGLILLGVLLFAILLPALYSQLTLLIHNIPQYTQQITELIKGLESQFSRLDIPPAVLGSLTNSLGQNNQWLAGMLNTIAGSVIALPGQVLNLVIQLILIAYFLLDGKKMIGGFISLFSEDNQVVVGRIFERSNSMFWRYLKAKLILATGMAIVSFVGFSLFGLDYALLLAVIAFVFDFIPYFGSILAGVVAFIVSFFSIGIPGCIWVALFVIVVQQIEGNVVGPKLQSDSVGIHPVTVLFALLASSAVWGPMAMFVAVPVAGFIKIVFLELRQQYQRLAG